MTRFFQIQVPHWKFDLAEICREAGKHVVTVEKPRGFEIEVVSKLITIVTWREKLSIERKFESELFGSQTYFELKVIEFSILFNATENRIVILDAPNGKQYLNRVLRLLFPPHLNIVYCTIDVAQTLFNAIKTNNWSVISLNSQSRVVADNINFTYSINGQGLLYDFVKKSDFLAAAELKSFTVQSADQPGGYCVSIFQSGNIKTSIDISICDTQCILEFIKIATNTYSIV